MNRIIVLYENARHIAKSRYKKQNSKAVLSSATLISTAVVPSTKKITW